MTTSDTHTLGPGSIFDDADIISVYTVEDAVEDGVLFDARTLSGDDHKAAAGKIFRDRFDDHPVYLTTALHALIERAVKNPKWRNDWAGVCHDVVWMASGAMQSAFAEARRCGSGRGTFTVIITGCGRSSHRRLDAVIDGNGLTFSLEGED